MQMNKRMLDAELKPRMTYGKQRMIQVDGVPKLYNINIESQVNKKINQNQTTENKHRKLTILECKHKCRNELFLAMAKRIPRTSLTTLQRGSLNDYNPGLQPQD